MEGNQKKLTFRNKIIPWLAVVINATLQNAHVVATAEFRPRGTGRHIYSLPIQAKIIPNTVRLRNNSILPCFA